jgi:5'-3' exonuclease
MSTENEPLVECITLFPNRACILPGTPLEEFEAACQRVILFQKAVNWWIGDLAIALEQQYPEFHAQAWPVDASPEQLSRCKAVAKAYEWEDRNPGATWSTHQHLKSRDDRVQAVAVAVENGMTSDEVAKDPPPYQAPPQKKPVSRRGLLAVDVNYFIHTYYHSGGGVESAMTFVTWLKRLAKRLHDMGWLTDLVCCIDSTTNHRKALTENWDAKYKPRSEKEPDLVRQLELAEELLVKAGVKVVQMQGMEADDLMASYAKKFNGTVSLLSGDKDMRQCLSETCNILRDVTWSEDEHTGKPVPTYHVIIEKRRSDKTPPEFFSISDHFNDGSTYNGTKITGITAEQWPHFQAIVGDSVDGIKGAHGIGAAGAMKLIQEFGTVQGVIEACKNGTDGLSIKKQHALLEFEDIAETTLLLTTLRTDLDVPMDTALTMELT